MPSIHAAETTINQANVEIYGKVAFIPIKFNMPENNACGKFGFDCPIGPNERKTLEISLPIMKQYPSLSVTVQLKLLNENKQPIACIEFPAKIADGPTSVH